MIVLYIVAAIGMKHTIFGQIYGIGGNERASDLCGTPPPG
jgi:ribose/xylose/arabinose/galactoside ABC-type transport system permease subunit